jgi:hypothetical protein
MTAYFSIIETDMTRNSLDVDPHLQALLSASPRFLRTRIQPRAAAAAIAHGLEHRSSSITVPGR